MRAKSVVAAGFGCFLTLCQAGSSASQAAVYYFNTDLDAASFRETPLLNAHQNELVLSDFTGTSDFYELTNEDDSRIVSILKSTGLFSSRKNSEVVVIAVDNLLDEEKPLMDEQPAFYVKKVPDFNGIEALFERIMSDMQEISSRKALSLRQGIHVISDHEAEFWHKRMNKHPQHGHCDDDTKLENDISEIKAITQYATDSDSAILHLTSLSGLKHKQLEHGRKKLIKAVKKLANKQSNMRIALIALASNSCRNSSDNSHGMMRKRDSIPSEKSGLSSQSVFDSVEKCEKSTNSCSGHGSCQKHGAKGFSCVCKPTYDESRKKTTRWGGNACQKKDVSTETQMFLWTGIGIIFVLAWSIKLLFSIGSDPLPGILGASTDQKSQN